MHLLDRRDALGLLVLAAGRHARAEDVPKEDVPKEAFDLLDWKLDGASDVSRRAIVLVPRGLGVAERVPVLVLLHGLGETSSDAIGVRAWIDRYGLISSHARLLHPPVRPQSGRGDLTEARAREINDALRTHPFDGRTIFVCPYTPNVWQKADPSGALDQLGLFITKVLLPEVRAKTPADSSPARTGIDGCSLGGFVGLEIFLRHPTAFGAWGGVQAALREASAPKWADRIARAVNGAGPRRLHIETSRADPFHAANVALSRELTHRGVPHDLTVLPGPHDQPWLREAGTIEMLLWHDRALSGG
jgi:enterochelin esterase-like enzyme